MTAIAQEIRSFIESTGSTQSALSRASGVPCPTISMLLSGKRKNLNGPNQDAIRDAMRRIESEGNSLAKKTAIKEDHHARQ